MIGNSTEVQKFPPTKEDVYFVTDSVVVDGAEKKRKLRGKGNCLEEAGLSKMRVSGNKLA